MDRHLRDALMLIMDMLMILLRNRLTDRGWAAYKDAIAKWYAAAGIPDAPPD